MKTKDIFMYILAALVVVCFFALLYIMIFEAVPDNNKDMMNLIVGSLIGAFTMVVNYFFGSSTGSKAKTEFLMKNGK